MTLSLAPWPRTVQPGTGPGVALDDGARIAVHPRAAAVGDDLAEALAARTGRDVVTTEEQGAPAADSRGIPIELSLRAGHDAEGYELSTDGRIRITAATPAGLFYGAQTLLQLVTRTADGWRVPDVRIEDSPRFGYRGLMLDVARHFLPVATVLAVIERAASLKFNHLHLHLTDDQGWRIALRSRPELTATAAGSSVGGDPGGFFSRSDYRRIVAHAARRQMTVVPEVDVPGHTHAVGLAYPELTESPVLGAEVESTTAEYGGDLPASGVPYTGIAVGFSSLRLHDPHVDDFLRDVFGELAELTPGPYLHLGGDEALGAPRGDYAAFVGRAAHIVKETGKTPIAWHEAGAARLPAGMIGQYWGYVTPTDGHDVRARAFVAHGGKVILSPADAIYLDMKPDARSRLGLTWANGPTSVEDSYSWDPAAVVSGLGDSDILGVEAPLWTETVRDLSDVDELAFPRIAAAAEAGWSPPTGSAERTWDSFRARVGGLGPLWRSQGIGFSRSAEIPWGSEEPS